VKLVRRIPLADAGTMAAPLRRARVIRLVLAAALAACIVATYASARSLDEGTGTLAPRGTNGVIVLDVSASISSSVYRQVGKVLRDAVKNGGSYGLVVFSDTAYEALPPGSPASALRGFARYFTPLRGSRNIRVQGTLRLGQYAFPINPWASGFTAGTKISTGLRLARRILVRDHVARPSIVLVSDLATDQSDVARLSATLITFRRADVPLRVVGLSATPSDEDFFAKMIGKNALRRAPLPIAGVATPPERTPAGGHFPGALVAACVALMVLLALNELWCGRLSWGAPAAERVAA
jgi:hypothetical protein